MAIKGLTDKTAAFPRIGELRKGEEKPKKGNLPGRDLTYFRFTTDDALARKMFADNYPDQDALRNIHVFLPHKTADENMDSWIEKWVAGGLVYRSDGETLVLWRTEGGAYSLEPKPDPYTELDANGKRKDGGQQVGRLSVIIPELGRFATVTILTTSKNDIINLTSQLRGYEALRGDLRGIPFIVRRRPEKISTPGQDGKRERRESWLLSIETQPTWSMAQLGMMEQAALPGGPVEKMLPAPQPAAYQLIADITNPFDDSDLDDTDWQDEAQPESTANLWLPSKVEFFEQVKTELRLEPDEAAAILREAGFTNGYNPERATEMYKAIQVKLSERKESAKVRATDGDQPALFPEPERTSQYN